MSNHSNIQSHCARAECRKEKPAHTSTRANHKRNVSSNMCKPQVMTNAMWTIPVGAYIRTILQASFKRIQSNMKNIFPRPRPLSQHMDSTRITSPRQDAGPHRHSTGTRNKRVKHHHANKVHQHPGRPNPHASRDKPSRM